jgi:hypothetical protein
MGIELSGYHDHLYCASQSINRFSPGNILLRLICLHDLRAVASSRETQKRMKPEKAEICHVQLIGTGVGNGPFSTLPIQFPSPMRRVAQHPHPKLNSDELLLALQTMPMAALEERAEQNIARCGGNGRLPSSRPRSHPGSPLHDAPKEASQSKQRSCRVSS